MKKGLFVTVKGQRRVSKHVDCCVLQESNRTKVIKVGFDDKKGNIFCNLQRLWYASKWDMLELATVRYCNDSRLKFVYSEKATKFCKIFCRQYIQTKVRWRFPKIFVACLLTIYELYNIIILFFQTWL